jgi:hypothetical protein
MVEDQMVSTYPDTEAAVKAAAKTALPVLAGRVFYSVPEGTPALPLLTVALISGGPDNGEAPLDRPRLTFSCWGKTKLEASDLYRDLVTWLRRLDSVQLDSSTFCYGVTDIFATWQPDDEARLARYVVDATLTVRSI